MTKRGFHALHGNIRAWKELPNEQYHVWMIAWSGGGLTKQGGASEDAASFGKLETTSATRQTDLVRVPRSPKVPRRYKGSCSFGELEINQRLAEFLRRAQPRSPNFTECFKGRLPRKGHVADLVGDSPSSLHDSARPLSFLGHFWASYVIIA
uniref:Uncharacterized protein n=1 Tax=Solanum tuberosum TaxID=4113 RepID=M1D9G7_SOLTU